MNVLVTFAIDWSQFPPGEKIGLTWIGATGPTHVDFTSDLPFTPTNLTSDAIGVTMTLQSGVVIGTVYRHCQHA